MCWSARCASEGSEIRAVGGTQRSVGEGDPSLGSRWLFRIVVGWVAAFVVMPVLIALPFSVDASGLLQFPPHGVTFHWYRELLGDPSWRRSIINSLKVGALATPLATCLGAALALGFRMAGQRNFGRSALYGMAMFPLVMPVLVVALALAYGYSVVNGAGLHVLGTVPGVALGQAFLGVPVVLAIVGAALAHLDRTTESAAATLGAGPMKVFFRVTYPQIRPAVLVAALFAFLTSFNDVIIPIFLGGYASQTLAQKIWQSISYQVDPVAAAASGLFIVVAIVAVSAGGWLGGTVTQR